MADYGLTAFPGQRCMLEGTNQPDDVQTVSVTLDAPGSQDLAATVTG